jgi:uncharacterized protein YndB with AHSA1/START domain
MKNKHSLHIAAQGERELVMTRAFAASRDLVFDALTKPDLLRRWLLGPTGWTMTVCAVDLRVGGRYRYEWRKDDGTEMGMGGIYREIVRPSRIVTTELFDEDWTGGEASSIAVLEEKAGTTTLTTTMLYASRESRDAVLKSGMERGVAAGYDRLDDIFASIAQGAA